MIRIDTNYIVRYLINDNEEMADIAEDLILNKELFIANEILAEVVYVLLGVYEVSREEVANQLLELISFENITTSNAKVITNTFEIFKSKNLDFVDCLLCAYSEDDEIVTFDKKLNKCILSKSTSK